MEQGLGELLARDLLLHLTHPSVSGYRIGVIVDDIFATGMAVSASGEPPVVDSSCLGLDGAISEFYSSLESVIASQVSLSDNPKEVVEAVIDPVFFTIQVPTAEYMIEISPSPTIGEPIYQASLDLYRVVQRCSHDLEGEVREHLF